MKKKENERPFKRQKVTDESESSVEELEIQFRKHSILTKEDRASLKEVILNVRKASREKKGMAPIIELDPEDSLISASLVGEDSFAAGDGAMETTD